MNKNKFKTVLSVSMVLFLSNCQQKESTVQLTDKSATLETQALYQNLQILAGSAVLFGQQDATAYGVGRNHPHESFCDIKDVTGAYPAVYGWDIGFIEESVNIDSVPFVKIARLIKEAHARGGVNTISWHEPFPGTNSTSATDSSQVNRVLPGGDLHKIWKNKIKLVGEFFLKLRDAEGKPIPIIFRPYHEHNGDWFWWGSKTASTAEYISLYRYTVEYLRDTLGVHQLLYALSPDRSRMKTAHADEDFLYAYPGDNYVDILGLDNYWDVGRSAYYNTSISREQQDSLLITSIQNLVRIAGQKNKIPVFAETGLDKLTEPDWFTKRILEPIKSDSMARKIAYILVWRNASQKHFYTPYPGHAASADFIEFYNDSFVLFENELPDMYLVKGLK